MSLKVQGLVKAFGGVRAVDGLDFAIDAGGVVALIGPNGAGKSTLFALLAGQLRPDAGTVEFDGVDLTRLEVLDRMRAGVGRTFQVAQVFVSMTVLQNAQLAVLAARGEVHDPLRVLWRLRQSEAQALLSEVGLQGQGERPASELAYGDLKRLEFALALAAQPRLLLMDEPTAGMAPAERLALMAMVAGLARARGTTVLFTEHSMDVVFGHAERVLVMSRGRLIANGSPDQVRADRQVRAVYLGEGP
ncbi:MAG: ABC transporter ATP-binding protein [Burkholderiaceae bacterium]